MTRTVHRGMPDQARQAAHLYLSSRLAEGTARAAKGTREHGPYSTVAEHCREHGEQDENGSFTWTMDEPITIGSKTYTGFRLQARQPAVYFDEEPAKALIDSLGPEVVAAATRTVTVYDLDYLFALRQTGKITSEELDEVLITPVKEYSLTVLEGT